MDIEKTRIYIAFRVLQLPNKGRNERREEK